MIFVFIIDTSASMNGLFSNNLTYLECAKSGVEHFFKWEHMSSNRANNKYMLVTYADQAYKTLLDTDNDQTLLQEVKMLQATDLSTAGTTFAKVFEYLDAYRRRNNFDNIGKGRYPADAETTNIFWFTDGGHYSEKLRDKWVLSDELHIPRLQTPGQEFYFEPFRWDQRLFTLWMTPTVDPLNKLPQMSTVMRGEWWQIPNVRYLMHCIDNCMHSKHPNVHPLAPVCTAEGVLVNMVESPVTAGNKPTTVEALMIHSTKSSTRHFPIPEAYWPDAIAPDPNTNTLSIPQRTAHPTIFYTRKDDIYPIPEGFPVDRYSIDQRSEIVQALMKQKEKISWTLYVQGSGQTSGFGEPFGTLKYSESSKTVSMYLMPYNFPWLFSAILDLRRKGSTKLANAANTARDIADYIRSVPLYYREPLRKAFTQIDLMHLWPPDVLVQPNTHIADYYSETVAKATLMAQETQKSLQHLRSLAITAQPTLTSKGKTIESLPTNPFDVPRDQLLSALSDLRGAFKASLGPGGSTTFGPGHRSQEEEDRLHSLPISQMGNYAPRMHKQQRQRDPLEDEEVAKRRDKNVFGNPYRQDKKVSIDEEDEASQMEVDVEAPDDEDAASLTSRGSGESGNTGATSTRKRRRLRALLAGSASSTTSTRSFKFNRVPRLSPSPAPILVVPPAPEWAKIREGSIREDMENRRRLAEQEYQTRQKDGAMTLATKLNAVQERSSPVTTAPKAAPRRDFRRNSTVERIGEWMTGVTNDLTHGSDSDISSDLANGMHPRDISPPPSHPRLDFNKENNVLGSPHDGQISEDSHIMSGMEPISPTDSTNGSPVDSMQLRHEDQVTQPWGRWDSKGDVRRMVHKAFAAVPKDYNRIKLLQTLSRVASSPHLNLVDRKFVLNHALSAARGFRRFDVLADIEALVREAGAANGVHSDAP
ncbi:uncharacterized protein EV422DRAFT_407263 [Fimicolochytrium jonesii]|uniref:uncharacterized protein n=1 Tax=Fimicolochytrium jonesii TaxID=1396493 RepID=UPI0022FDBD07|nr:uncharacterized protein EV422DRAFT_407263 [Fimicolochytrium jonesii]KAI8822622.1 hypothetical protein EV422DRAFT_407263 [Fimicolochytrium jonesii]